MLHGVGSCCFYWIGEGSSNGWVADRGLVDAGIYDKYVTAFYWAIMTMSVPLYESANLLSRRTLSLTL